jgi:hypothetical protein
MKTAVTIDFIEHAKIMHWVRKAGPLEVSGFGKVVRAGSHLHVSKVYLLKQENTSGSTILDAGALSQAMYLYKDEPGDFNFWWHSHHSMAAFFSTTDHDTIKDLGSNGWLLATCFNNRGETKTGLYTTVPIPVLHEDMTIQVTAPPLPEAFREQLDNQYRELVNEKRFAVERYQWHETRAERKARRRFEREFRRNHGVSLRLGSGDGLGEEEDREFTDEELAEVLAAHGFADDGELIGCGYN